MAKKPWKIVKSQSKMRRRELIKEIIFRVTLMEYDAAQVYDRGQRDGKDRLQKKMRDTAEALEAIAHELFPDTLENTFWDKFYSGWRDDPDFLEAMPPGWEDFMYPNYDFLVIHKPFYHAWQEYKNFFVREKIHCVVSMGSCPNFRATHFRDLWSHHAHGMAIDVLPPKGMTPLGLCNIIIEAMPEFTKKKAVLPFHNHVHLGLNASRSQRSLHSSDSSYNTLNCEGLAIVNPSQYLLELMCPKLQSTSQ